MSLIEVKNLYFQYNQDEPILNNVNINIEKGEFVSIIGLNGSGKSTLAKLLVGLLEPNKGEILLDGKNIFDNNELNKRIGIVFQNPDNQFVGVTVKDDIAFGLENRQVPVDKMNELIEEYSKKVNMNHMLNCNPEKLSGGEKQRVAIAGILALKTDIIILDEATSMLDPNGCKDVMNLVNEIKKEKTIISITHNLEEAIKADRLVIINNGCVKYDGVPTNAFMDSNLIKSNNLDSLDIIKLIELVKKSQLNNKEDVEAALWELI